MVDCRSLSTRWWASNPSEPPAVQPHGTQSAGVFGPASALPRSSKSQDPEFVRHCPSHGCRLPVYCCPDFGLCKAFPVQTYDFLMLAIVILSAIFGVWKGMAWQLAALASLLVSAAVAIRYGGPLAGYINLEAPWDRCVAMVAIYLVTSLAIWLLFRMVAGIIDRVQLREFDRQVGALFGAAKGVLWCLVITYFAVTLSESARQKILRSRSGYYTALLIRRAGPVLPPEISDVLGGYIEQLGRKLEGVHPPDGQPTAGTPRVRTGDPGAGGTQGELCCRATANGRQTALLAACRDRSSQTRPCHISDDLQYFHQVLNPNWPGNRTC